MVLEFAACWWIGCWVCLVAVVVTGLGCVIWFAIQIGCRRCIAVGNLYWLPRCLHVLVAFSCVWYFNSVVICKLLFFVGLYL